MSYRADEWKFTKIYADSKILDLSNNKIDNIENGAFYGLSKLIYLSLRNNKLKNIEAETFFGLESIKEIQLSENQIRKIDPMAFNYLTKIEFLALNKNYIVNISELTFKNLTFLRELQLNYNHIESLVNNIFNDLSCLETLFLFSNGINYLDAEIFMNIKDLISLNLGNNSLKTIDLRYLRKLEILYLDFNQFSTFKTNLSGKINNSNKTLFCHLSTIKRLYLDGNPLVHLNSSFFESNGIVPSLVCLSICYCQLESIDNDAFKQYKNLELLLMERNRLLFLNNTIIAGLSALRYVRMDQKAISGSMSDLKFLYPM
ncbi:unnamed protein product, partial [Brachionus calyciflorus]